MVILSVYAPYVYWKMGEYQNVTPVVAYSDMQGGQPRQKTSLFLWLSDKHIFENTCFVLFCPKRPKFDSH